MRRVVAFVTIVMALVGTSALAVNREKQAYLLDEVLRLSHEGVPDRLILKQIEAMDFAFELSADDIVELRTLGVSDDVIEAMIDTVLHKRERERDSDAYVRVSAGYYSPWYQFPYAWGFYYDPFPDWYSYYYYPFHYSTHHLGWYGWCGNSYYYTYNWYTQPYAHHDRDYRRYRDRDRHRADGYHTARGVDAEVASVPVRPVRDVPRGSGVAPARVRGNDANPAPRQRIIATRVARPTVQAPRTPYRADRVSTPPTREQNGSRSRRSVGELRAPISTPERPGASPAEPVVREPEAPAVRQREVRPPTLNERRATTVEPPKAPSHGGERWSGATTERMARFAAPILRGQSSGPGVSSGNPVASAPATAPARGISRGKSGR